MDIAGLATVENRMNTKNNATVVDVLPVQFTILYYSIIPGIAPTTDIRQMIKPYARLALPKMTTAIELEMLLIIDTKMPVLPATRGNYSRLIKAGVMRDVVPKPKPAFKKPAMNPIKASLIIL